MKISEFFEGLSVSDREYLSVIEKGGFYILLQEDAFFLAKKYSFKLTKLDSTSIKIGFPKASKEKWLAKLRNEKLSYKVYEKCDWELKEEIVYRWSASILYDYEDYKTTSERILEPKLFAQAAPKTRNFLLKDKLEDIFILLQGLLLRLPRKERYFIREKIERNFLDLLEKVYRYMYDKQAREILASELMYDVMVVREFTRFLYMTGNIKNDNVYLDLSGRWVEVLKIVKALHK